MIGGFIRRCRSCGMQLRVMLVQEEWCSCGESASPQYIRSEIDQDKLDAVVEPPDMGLFLG